MQSYVKPTIADSFVESINERNNNTYDAREKKFIFVYTCGKPKRLTK